MGVGIDQKQLILLVLLGTPKVTAAVSSAVSPGIHCMPGSRKGVWMVGIRP